MNSFQKIKATYCDLSVILPIHNESESIQEVIEDIKNVLQEETITYEIICVENGSVDNSLEVIQQLSKQDDRVRVVTSDVGWGNAVRKGIAEARGFFISYMVSDGQIDPDALLKVYRVIATHPIALVKTIRLQRENLMRLVVSWFYNTFACLLFGFLTRDINATPKIFRSSDIKAFSFISPNIAFDLELLLAFKDIHTRWIEVPIPAHKRKSGTSTTNIYALLEMLQAMLCFRFFRHRHSALREKMN